LVVAGNWVYFNANDGKAGQELWREPTLPAWLAPEGASAFRWNQGSLIVTGNVTLTDNAASTTPGLRVSVLSGGRLTLTSSETLADLLIDSGGTVRMTDGSAPRSLYVTALSVAPTARLDLGANGLAINYTGTSRYDWVRPLVISGRNGGSWSGNGISSSSISASTALGLVEASDVLGLTGTQTRLWLGQTVDATTLLVKYTYAGDADLNGKIDGDDYFIIDSYRGTFASGHWAHGDFDYNGWINGDDYFLLDSNIGRQGAAL
jgi:hypothetical protein